METTYIKSHGKSKGSYIEAVTEDEFGNVLRTRRVYYPSKTCYHNGKLYFLQYNDQMELLYDVCHYLNYSIDGCSDKTKKFKAFVLRRYVCFMELLGFDYRDLSDQYVIDRVDSFLHGEDYRSDVNTDRRKHKTANNYRSVIRDFIRLYNKGKGVSLDSYHSPKDLTPDGKRFKKRYPSSRKENPHANDIIKPFLYPSEFMNLVRIATDRKDIQALMLFHLMFFYGLRIGECLGLTEEDFVIRRRQYEPSPTILLRNRLSDRDFQYAKELFHPSSLSDYNEKLYPHDKVVLSMQFYEKLTVFVESVRIKFKTKGIHERSVADCISKQYQKEHGANHYIFLNKYGKPLSQAAWNPRLKDYFLAANIQLDIGVKRDSLNHRFRHGCAMYYLRFAEKRMTINELQSFLRHKSSDTTNQYLKIRVDENLVLHQQFQDSLLREIPLLYEE